MAFGMAGFGWAWDWAAKLARFPVEFFEK